MPKFHGLIWDRECCEMKYFTSILKSLNLSNNILRRLARVTSKDLKIRHLNLYFIKNHLTR